MEIAACSMLEDSRLNLPFFLDNFIMRKLRSWACGGTEEDEVKINTEVITKHQGTNITIPHTV